MAEMFLRNLKNFLQPINHQKVRHFLNHFLNHQKVDHFLNHQKADHFLKPFFFLNCPG